MKLLIKYLINGQAQQCCESNSHMDLIVNYDGTRYTLTVKPKAEIQLVCATLEKDVIYNKTDRIFVNGYQSWTDSKEFYPNENLKNVLRLPKFLINKYGFQMYGDAYFKRYKKGVLHGYDISYIVGEAQLSILSLNTKNAYLIINHCISKNKIVFESDVKGLTIKNGFTLFDFCLTGESIQSLAKTYYGNCTCEHIFGYTSWYNHYQDINQQKLLYSLDNLDKRFNLFQIDDGYETFVGDWLEVDKNKFPDGLKPILSKTHKKGLKAGIWLAPFAVEKNSKVYKDHYDWLLKDENGEAILCGSNWSGFYSLDIYNKEARNYIVQCLKYYKDMGFDFFKLDFLYCVCIVTPENKTRAQVSYDAYTLIRQTLGDKLILGCGAMITSAIGLFDYMRIGPDVSLEFDDVWFMRFMHRERISTKNTIQNTIYRSFLNKTAFGNDPDVFLLRDGVKLNHKQKQALVILNCLFGSVLMTSDDICNYDNSQLVALNTALSMRDKTVQSYKRIGEDIEIILSDNSKLIYNTVRGELIL